MVAGSVLLNVGLLILLSRSGARPETVADQAPPSPEPYRHEIDRATSPAGYFRALVSGGWSHEEAKRVLLALLEMDARHAAALPETPYWKPQEASRLDYSLRLFDERAHVRSVLTELLGSDAESDPALSDAFAPLGPAFSFLTSEQQVSVQRLKLEREQSILRATQAASPAGPIRGGQTTEVAAPADLRTPLHEFRSALAGVLSEDLRFEYLLRDSPLAEQLRRSDVRFTEIEFREAFEILDALERSRGDQESYAESRAALRALLGGRRFALLWASRDPLFSVIEQACESHSLTSETVLTVYEMFNDNQDRLIQAAEAASNDPSRGVHATREVRAELQRELTGLLGEEVAKDILHARTQHMLRMMNSQRLAPR